MVHAMDDMPAGRRDATKAANRQKIIDATKTCIAEHGIAGVTVSRISRLAGLSRGMVNTRFDSKENLLLEVLGSIAEDYLHAIEDAVRGIENDPARALRREIETEIGFWTRSHAEACAWFAFRAAALSNPDYMAICGPRESAYYSILSRFCDDLVHTGGYDGVDAGHVAYGLSALLEGLWFDWVSYPGAFDPEKALGACMAYLAACFPRHF